MPAWQVIIAVLITALVTYTFGYNRGLAGCPEQTAYQQERDAMIDEEVRALMSEPIGRDAVCEKIFDLVLEEAGTETFLENDYRDSQPREGE